MPDMNLQNFLMYLHDQDVQRILRERLILVHGNTFDYNYGWDLKSFGRLHDVDKMMTVHGKVLIPFYDLFYKYFV